MVDHINHLAQSLITIHGADALKVAEHAAANVRGLGMAKALAQRNLVIAAIKKIQATG
jgi:hypothetical protein